jgi:hypothetical protein
MRTTIQPHSHFASRQSSFVRNLSVPSFRCSFPLTSLALFTLAAVLFANANPVQAQAPAVQAPAPASAAAKKPIHPRKHPIAAQVPVTSEPAATAPVTPPAPETPKWPAFDHPADASVIWDSQGLRIDAQNSSLQQILKDVSTATGVKVEGLNSDERVFGAYGPGQARDVLSQLLQGSAYNVIMVGDLGQGAPRQLLLSIRQAAGQQPAARSATNYNVEEDETDDQTPPPEPAPVRSFPPGSPPRTPQQIMQEMQQRQLQNQQPAQQQPQPPQPQD